MGNFFVSIESMGERRENGNKEEKKTCTVASKKRNGHLIQVRGEQKNQGV